MTIDDDWLIGNSYQLSTSVDCHQRVLISINECWWPSMSVDCHQQLLTTNDVYWQEWKKSLNVKKVNVYAYAHKKIKYFDFSNDFWLLEIDQVIKTQENC